MHMHDVYYVLVVGGRDVGRHGIDNRFQFRFQLSNAPVQNNNQDYALLHLAMCI